MQTGSERGTLAMTFKFSDLQTSQATTSSSEWSGQGARLQLVKSGKKIQAQIAGTWLTLQISSSRSSSAPILRNFRGSVRYADTNRHAKGKLRQMAKGTRHV